MASIIQRLSVLSILVSYGLAATPTLAESADTATLLQAAASGPADARYAAIDDLGERHEAAETVVPQLVILLKDSDPKVRWRSARSLGDYGIEAKAAAPELRKLLHDKEHVVTYHAVVTLGKIGDVSDETIDALVTMVTNPDGRLARAAITSIRHLNPDPERVVGVLEQVLQSNDDVVVAHALEAVVERGEKAVPVLNAALKQPKTAYLACAAIERIGPDAAGTVPGLVELIGSTKHSQLLIEALLALASIGPAAQSASPQIIPLLDHATDKTVPVAAAYALGSIGATDADEPLRRTMSKPNAFLEMVCAWSLAKIHPKDAQLRQQAMEKLQAGLKSKDEAIRAAAEKASNASRSRRKMPPPSEPHRRRSPPSTRSSPVPRSDGP